MALSLGAWLFAGVSASPLYIFAEVAFLRLRNPVPVVHKLCIAKWPNSDVARWYITASSVLIFALPLAVIIFCYYHILNKLREALKSCKRLKRGASSRAPYHRVTRFALNERFPPCIYIPNGQIGSLGGCFPRALLVTLLALQFVLLHLSTTHLNPI